MQRRIAVKRLTASDLTLFEWHFRNRNAGNQKSINLNANVFVDQLFPSLTVLPHLALGRKKVVLRSLLEQWKHRNISGIIPANSEKNTVDAMH